MDRQYPHNPQGSNNVPLKIVYTSAPAPDPPFGQAGANSAREHVQRDLSAPLPVLDPDAAATHEAPSERAPKRPVPYVMRYARKEAREEERPREADGGPDGGDKRAEEGRAAQDGEQRAQEASCVQEGTRAGEEDGEEVDLVHVARSVQHPSRRAL